jgi:hypothetical protein
MLDPTTEVQPRGRRSTLGLERIASLW